jgi:hypothetical protein
LTFHKNMVTMVNMACPQNWLVSRIVGVIFLGMRSFQGP